jgi:DNA polymerase III subunit alpha
LLLKTIIHYNEGKECKKVGRTLSFVHLHVRSAYSLLNSAAKMEELVKKASELGFHALALTDENVLYGVIPFYKECQKYGLKPIIGMIADIVLERKQQSFPLVLLAKNETGYRNLLKISSVIQTKAPGGIPEKWLRYYTDGLIAITPGINGYIETLLLQKQFTEAMDVLTTYKQLFGNEQFYIGLQNHGLNDEADLQMELIRFSEETNTPLVATNDVHYVNKEDAFVHDCLLAIKHGVKLDDEKRPRLQSNEYYLKSTKEMIDLFRHSPSAVANTVRIAEQCNVKIELGKIKLPKYPVPTNQSAHDYLRELCLKGLHDRFLQPEDVYLKRLEYELDVIKKTNFSDYFLIVWDLMKFAHEQGILTGPGRGSAAGSLVAYVLHITNVDPIKYGLLFERFLNPERISMPDIDIDFPDERRDEVIQYVVKKYGKQHVAQIITFGTLAAKAALRDIGRVMGASKNEIDFLAKQVPNKIGITLREAYEQSPSLQRAVKESPLARKIFETALKIEGLPRHTSTHAAGVVISEQPLSDIVPLQEGYEQIYLTQYPMDILEELGLLKMDFLGLRTLTLIENVRTLIKHKTGKTLDLQEIPFDDAKTYALLSRGETTGVFQLESEGMRKVLQELQPSKFEDIVAANALYRPGPMDYIPVYIKRKHRQETVSYPHPDLEPILKSTYGVLIYQEQIMQIAAKMAGFSLGQADLLRRAVGKKKKEILDKEREHFVKGCMEKGYSKETANDIYDLIVRFANYGFNRSHAVAYSMIAYQLAYLKANYPLYFYAALLTSIIGHEEKVAQYILEAKQKNISILPPSINKSFYPFSIEDGKIRYSLAAIKNVGAAAVKAIIQERKKRPFTDLFDVCIRLSPKTINRKMLESFVLAGCFDEFGVERASLLASLDVALEHAELVRPDDGLGDLFAEEFSLKPKYVKAEPLTEDEKLKHEKELLGVYLSSHPVSPYIKRFQSFDTLPISHMAKALGKQKISVGAYIIKERKTRTKTGEEMAFFTISDESGEVEAVAFPDVYNRYRQQLHKGAVLLFQGKVEIRQGHLQLVIKQIWTIEELKEAERSLYLKISPDHIAMGKLSSLKTLLQQYPGPYSVFLYYEQEKRTVKLSEDYCINLTNECLEELKELLGAEYVAVK